MIFIIIKKKQKILEKRILSTTLSNMQQLIESVPSSSFSKKLKNDLMLIKMVNQENQMKRNQIVSMSNADIMFSICLQKKYQNKWKNRAQMNNTKIMQSGKICWIKQQKIFSKAYKNLNMRDSIYRNGKTGSKNSKHRENKKNSNLKKRQKRTEFLTRKRAKELQALDSQQHTLHKKF